MLRLLVLPCPAGAELTFLNRVGGVHCYNFVPRVVALTCTRIRAHTHAHAYVM